MTDADEACPNCGAPVDESAASEQGAVQRAGCPACGLQLVRRPGQPWAGIRG